MSLHLYKCEQKRSKNDTLNLTKNKNSGISKDRPGDGQPLPLPSRNIGSAIPKPCIIPIWQILDKAMQKSCPTGFNDILTRRVLGSPFVTWSRETHCDVIVNGHIKQDDALGDYSDLLSGPIGVEIADILVIQGDRTSLYVVHAKQELGNGGFPGT
jgi:hypothetical protein